MKRGGLGDGVVSRGLAAGGLVGCVGLRAQARRQRGTGPKMGSANVWAALLVAERQVPRPVRVRHDALDRLDEVHCRFGNVSRYESYGVI